MSIAPFHGSLMAALLLFCTAPAFAIYKCESGGKVIYSDEACAGGKALNINAAPPADADAAMLRAEQERQLAERLGNARQKRDAADEKEMRRTARADAQQQRKCAKLARQQKWADEDAASASGKRVEAARRKAQRLADDYIAECGIKDSLSLAR